MWLLPDLDVVVAAVALTGALGAVAVAASVRITPTWAAWAADRWTSSRDRFATAVELRARGDLHDLDARQVLAAEESAGGIDRFPSGPNVPTRMLGIGLVAVLVAGGLGVIPNPRDDERVQRAIEAAQVEEVAEELRTVADELDQPGEPEREALAERLRELAAELDGASLEEALDTLSEARSELARELEDDLASQRTALSGLAQELGQQPLGAGDTVRSQLDGLASQLAAGAREPRGRGRARGAAPGAGGGARGRAARARRRAATGRRGARGR